MDVTVIITAYDEGDLVGTAVESVLAQTAPAGSRLPEMEVILVHDRGTRPETAAVVEDVRRRHPAVRSMENRLRRGVGGARNTGIDAAQGEWLAFLDGDDIWFPAALHTRWSALRDHPDVGWLASDFVRAPGLEGSPPGAAFTRDNSHLRGLMGQPRVTSGDPFDNGSPFRIRKPVAEFCQASLCWTGTVMARRDLVQRVGCFHEGLERGEDTHLWIRLAASSDFLFVPVPLALYRTRPSTLDRRGTTLRGWDILGTMDLLWRPLMRPWIRHLYRGRLVRMMNEQALYLRSRRRFLAAAAYAAASGVLWPLQERAWRCLAGALVRRA